MSFLLEHGVGTCDTARRDDHERQAALFGLDAGAPAFRITRVTYDANERPFELTVTLAPGDRQQLRALLPERPRIANKSARLSLAPIYANAPHNKGPGATPEGVSRSRKAARTTPEGVAPGPVRSKRVARPYASFSTNA